jgi:hypothetical protein
VGNFKYILGRFKNILKQKTNIINKKILIQYIKWCITPEAESQSRPQCRISLPVVERPRKLVLRAELVSSCSPTLVLFVLITRNGTMVALHCVFLAELFKLRNTDTELLSVEIWVKQIQDFYIFIYLVKLI